MPNIHPHTSNGRNWLLVGVPEDAKYFSIEYYENHKDKYIHFIESYFRGLPNYGEISLPPGNYRFHCKASEATEEQASEVVDEYLQAYKDYEHNALVYTRATAALHSLCRSFGLEPGEVVVLEVG